MELDINQLEIGNKITSIYGDSIITNIENDQIKSIIIRNGIEICLKNTGYCGIFLDKDILLDYNFSEVMSSNDIRISLSDGRMIQFYFDDINDNMICYIGDDEEREDIKFLHQLQNLYYQLEGKYLEMN